MVENKTRKRIRGGQWLLLAILLILQSCPVMAADTGYTMCLIPSATEVAPGETIRMTLQVRNDGWPSSGDAEAAAFQVQLEYDRNSLEYEGVEVMEGTIGDFSPDSGMILGYGEGHSFQETLDCAVLTMKVTEGASGEISIGLKDPILGRQDATELKVSVAEPLILRIGKDDSGNDDGAQAAQESGNAGTGTVSGAGMSRGSQSSGRSPSSESGTAVTENGRTAGGNETAPAAVSQDGTESQKEPGTVAARGAGKGTESENAGSGQKSENASSDAAGTVRDPEAAGYAKNTVPAEDHYEEVRDIRSVSRLAWGIVPVAAAAVAGFLIYRRRRS